MKKVVLFDLDGTLTESGEGIMKSVQYALEKMGKPEPDIGKLSVFVGPPLSEQFMKYANLSREEAKKAVFYYRERYSAIGIFENRPYPGIPEMLARLRENGFVLAVASSKPEKFVLQVLEHFKIKEYFDEAVGKEHDVIGAGEAGVSCVAVAYGYGTLGELEAVKPLKIVHTVKELQEYLLFI